MGDHGGDSEMDPCLYEMELERDKKVREAATKLFNEGASYPSIEYNIKAIRAGIKIAEETKND